MWSSALVTITKRANNPEDGGNLYVKYSTGRVPTSASATYYPPFGGNGVRGSGFTGSEPQTTYSTSMTNGIHRFQGITIPQFATIDSAILTIWGRNKYGQTTFKLGMKAINEKQMSDAFPVSFDSMTNPTTVRDLMFPHRTNFVKKTATPTADASVTKEITATYHGNSSTWFDEPAVAEWDVQELVQNLVNNFDYNVDDMIFQIGPKVGLTGTDFENSFYTLNNFSQTGNPPSSKYYSTSPPSGTTKYQTAPGTGVSIRVPKLVINFSIPVTGPVLRSCRTVDALLVKRGEDWGRCGDEVFW